MGYQLSVISYQNKTEDGRRKTEDGRRKTRERELRAANKERMTRAFHFFSSVFCLMVFCLHTSSAASQRNEMISKRRPKAMLAGRVGGGENVGGLGRIEELAGAAHHRFAHGTV